jgi:O-acetylserine/cysteine efflux transporter
MVLITAIQALCFTLIKTGLDFAPPLLFGGLRAMIGGGALLGLVIVKKRTLVPPKSAWAGTLVLAVVATTIAFGAMFLSPGRTHAGVASAVGNLQPFLTLVMASLWLNEALTAGKAAAVTLGLIGVTLISYPALADSGAIGISGVSLALAVSFGSSVGNVLVKRMRLGDLLLTVTGWQLVIGGLLLLLLSAFVEDGPALKVNLEFLALLLFLALIGTAFITALWYSFVQEGEVGRLSTFFFLVPVFGLAIAAFIFDENVGALTLGGVFAILLAVGVMVFEMGSQDSARRRDPA